MVTNKWFVDADTVAKVESVINHAGFLDCYTAITEYGMAIEAAVFAYLVPLPVLVGNSKLANAIVGALVEVTGEKFIWGLDAKEAVLAAIETAGNYDSATGYSNGVELELRMMQNYQFLFLAEPWYGPEMTGQAGMTGIWNDDWRPDEEIKVNTTTDLASSSVT